MTLRRLRHLVVLLLLGAIMNVAAAWSCAITVDRWSKQTLRIGESTNHAFCRWWMVNTVERFGATLTSSTATGDANSEYAGVREPSVHVEINRAPSAEAAMPWWCPELQPQRLLAQFEWSMKSANGFGWPMRSMVVLKDEHEPDVASRPIKLHGVPLWIRGSHRGMTPTWPVELPTQVLWLGFALNTIFYAAILWVLFFAPGTIKRAIRRRRGLCPACAYPVGTSPVCTECGTPLKTPRAESQIAESPE